MRNSVPIRFDTRRFRTVHYTCWVRDCCASSVTPPRDTSAACVTASAVRHVRTVLTRATDANATGTDAWRNTGGRRVPSTRAVFMWVHQLATMKCKHPALRLNTRHTTGERTSHPVTHSTQLAKKGGTTHAQLRSLTTTANLHSSWEAHICLAASDSAPKETCPHMTLMLHIFTGSLVTPTQGQTLTWTRHSSLLGLKPLGPSSLPFNLNPSHQRACTQSTPRAHLLPRHAAPRLGNRRTPRALVRAQVCVPQPLLLPPCNTGKNAKKQEQPPPPNRRLRYTSQQPAAAQRPHNPTPENNHLQRLPTHTVKYEMYN